MTEEIIKCLPKRISEQLIKYDVSSINEIRLAVNRPITLTVGEKSVLLGDTVSNEEMTVTVFFICLTVAVEVTV